MSGPNFTTVERETPWSRGDTSFLYFSGGNAAKEFFMKNMAKLVGIIAMVTVIGVLFVACDDAKHNLEGTSWVCTQNIGEGWPTVTTTFRFDRRPNLTQTIYLEGANTLMYKGTYSIFGSTVTLTTEGYSGKGKLSGNKLLIDGEEYTKR